MFKSFVGACASFVAVVFTPGITGNVSIDDNGDRNADYSLLDMDPVSGEFEVRMCAYLDCI